MRTRERKLLIYTNLLIIFHVPLLSTHSISDIHKRFSFLIFLLSLSPSPSLSLWRDEKFLFSRKYWFEKNRSWNATIVIKRVYDFKDDEFVFLFIQQSYFCSHLQRRTTRNLTGKDSSCALFALFSAHTFFISSWIWWSISSDYFIFLAKSGACWDS